ncbi:MAG: flavodoxin family protein [Bacteroidales bacterium]|nr:flavodoxin family protein [Bacteroidales bacterium]
MKVTAFVGSARKKHSYQSVENLLQKLSAMGDIHYEIVHLSDYPIGICTGCKQCLDKGEERCRLKDSRDELLEKIEQSDGVIFASPNYAFHVSGRMKLFIDRLAYIFHRPCFFGKTFTSIVAQGIFGGNKIVSYFNFIGKALGFKVVKGICINSLEPMTEKVIKKNEEKIVRLSKRYYAQLMKKQLPRPSLFDMFVFRMSRTSMKIKLNDDFKDFRYYREKGWFQTDYYYPVSLSPMKKLAGNLFDYLATKVS